MSEQELSELINLHAHNLSSVALRNVLNPGAPSVKLSGARSWASVMQTAQLHGFSGRQESKVISNPWLWEGPVNMVGYYFYDWVTLHGTVGF